MNITIIEQIEEMWSKDCLIDPLNLQQSSIDTYRLHSKYFKMLNTLKSKLFSLDSEKNKLISIKTDYYLGNLDIETIRVKNWKPFKRVILKADLQQHISADDEVISLNLKLNDVKIAIEFTDSIIRTINNRGFHIKNILEDRRFINGGN